MNYSLVPKGKMTAALFVEVTQQCGVFAHVRLTIWHFTSDGLSISRLSIAKQNLIWLIFLLVSNVLVDMKDVSEEKRKKKKNLLKKEMNILALKHVVSILYFK